MIFIILKIMFLNVLWVFAWKIATEEGMILEKLGSWGSRKVDEGYRIFDGLITCPWCLPNFHGILIVWPLAFLLEIVPLEWDWKYLAIHVFVVGGASFICGTLWTALQTLFAYKKYLDNLNGDN